MEFPCSRQSTSTQNFLFELDGNCVPENGTSGCAARSPIVCNCHPIRNGMSFGRRCCCSFDAASPLHTIINAQIRWRSKVSNALLLYSGWLLSGLTLHSSSSARPKLGDSAAAAAAATTRNGGPLANKQLFVTAARISRNKRARNQFYRPPTRTKSESGREGESEKGPHSRRAPIESNIRESNSIIPIYSIRYDAKTTAPAPAICISTAPSLFAGSDSTAGTIGGSITDAVPKVSNRLWCRRSFEPARGGQRGRQSRANSER